MTKLNKSEPKKKKTNKTNLKYKKQIGRNHLTLYNHDSLTLPPKPPDPGAMKFIILEETLFFYFITMHMIQWILTQGQRRRFSKNDCIHLEPHLNTRTLDTGTINCIFLELQTHSFSK